MTKYFELNRDGWLNGVSDDAEARTFTRLRFSIFDEILTRNVSKRGGGESEAINTSLLPLAEFFARNWWPLMYEPIRPRITDAFRVRHRLDSGMRGYAFPAIALWSAGEGAVTADWASFDNPFATISFLASRPEEPVQLDRNVVETVLFDLIETVIERAGGAADELVSAWDRVRSSFSNPDEIAYCCAAGNLGLDPYDPDSPDLTRWTDGVADELFSDISEIVEVPDIERTVDWVREANTRLKLFPEINLSDFGDAAPDSLRYPAWMAGQTSAEELRERTGISAENPRAAVGDLLGRLVSDEFELERYGPDGITALIQKPGSYARIGTVSRSARQRRFRSCAAFYLAWTAEDGQDRAATEAITRRQQASRAFAAEMVAPRQALLARAGRSGFDEEDLQNLAGEFICPYETVMWQSIRADIPLRGIEVPRINRARVVTPQTAL